MIFNQYSVMFFELLDGVLGLYWHQCFFWLHADVQSLWQTDFVLSAISVSYLIVNVLVIWHEYAHKFLLRTYIIDIKNKMSVLDG